MRRAAPFLLLIALFAALPRGAAAQSSDPRVIVAKVDGSIDRVLASFLRDQVAEAESSGSTLVLQLDSAGTLDQDGVALAEEIHAATVPVIVWVGPTPAKAEGAGLLLMYAASLGAVAPGAGVGPVEPLDLANPTASAEDRVSDLATGWAEDFGKPIPLVFPDEPIPAQAGLDGNIAQVAALSVPDLLEKVDGLTVGTAAGPVELRTKIATSEAEEPVSVRFAELGPIDKTLHAAASPTWIYVLLVLGLAALAFELTQPGFGFAGFAGIGMVALGVYGLTVVPFSIVGLGVLLLGIGLLTLDVRMRRLGPPTAVGLVGFATGSFLVFGGLSDEIDISPWLIVAFTIMALLYWGFGLTVAIQTRERLTSTQKGLVGLVGETRGELKPDGPVFVKGTLWRGRSAGDPIPQGTRVRVRGVDGLILRVEPDPAPAAEATASPE
ncbi:MAG TPA: NfeD family protein [Actinomycetota bacterium]|nr:NfeD family protein [Actinomycetota bacterium]